MSKTPFQIWLLAGINLFIMMGFGLVSPVLPLYAESFNVSYSVVGILISVFPTMRLFTNLPGGILGSRYGERMVCAVGAGIVACGGWVSGSAPTFSWLIAGQALQGLGSSLYVTNSMSFIVSVTPNERMGKTMSLYHASFSLGVSAGPMVGGLLAGIGGLRLPFFVYGILAAVSAVLTWTFIRTETSKINGEKPPGLLSQAREIRRLFGRYEYVMALLLTGMIFWIRAGARQTALPLFARDTADLDPFGIGILMSIITVTNLLILWPAGRAVDRSRKKVAVVSTFAVAIAVATIGWADSFSSLIWVSIFFGMTTGFCGVPPSVIASDLMPAHVRGAGLGVFRMAGDLGFILGPVVSGLAITYVGYSNTFLVLATGALLTAGLALRMRETLISPRSKTPPTERLDTFVTERARRMPP
jgi:MFS family permease